LKLCNFGRSDQVQRCRVLMTRHLRLTKDFARPAADEPRRTLQLFFVGELEVAADGRVGFRAVVLFTPDEFAVIARRDERPPAQDDRRFTQALNMDGGRKTVQPGVAAVGDRFARGQRFFTRPPAEFGALPGFFRVGEPGLADAGVVAGRADDFIIAADRDEREVRAGGKRTLGFQPRGVLVGWLRGRIAIRYCRGVEGHLFNNKEPNHSMRLNHQPSGRPFYPGRFFGEAPPGSGRRARIARGGCRQGTPSSQRGLHPGRSCDGANAVKAGLARATGMQAAKLLTAKETARGETPLLSTLISPSAGSRSKPRSIHNGATGGRGCVVRRSFRVW